MMLDKAKLSKKPNFDNGLYTKSALPALIFSWVLCNIYVEASLRNWLVYKLTS